MIPYIILNERPSASAFDIPSFLLRTKFSALIPHLPITLDHMYIPIAQYHRSFLTNRYQIADFRFIFDDYSESDYLKFLNDANFLVIIILSQRTDAFLKALSKASKPTMFIHFLQDDETLQKMDISANNLITDFVQIGPKLDRFIYEELVEKISADAKDLLINIEKSGIRINRFKYSKSERIPTFGPTITNNLKPFSYTRKIWSGNNFSTYDVEQNSDRSKLILKSIEAVDQSHLNLVDLFSDKSFKRYYAFQPIILSLPYVNKRIQKKIVGSANVPKFIDVGLYNSGLRSEQDPSTFCSIVKIRDQKEVEDGAQSFILGADYNRRRIQATSATLSFHSLLSGSPIYRGPSTGLSIDVALDFFEPEKYQNTSNFRKQKKKIIELGKALSDRFDKEFLKYLSTRNGEIISISDLPMEMMTIGNTPLFFKFDHTRVLESSHGSQMSLFARAAKGLGYVLSAGTLKKILVVCCVPEDKNIFKVFEALKGVASTVRGLEDVVWCTAISVEQLSDLVKKYRPEVLIIDTHGKHRESGLDSVIQVGNDFVDGSDIIKYRIGAPIVILSACSTSPLKGYVNPIGQAFFENGAFSVLSTMLPVDILKSSTVYFRLLSNLPNAIRGGFHQNWSSYVSHILRTSVFEDFLQVAQKAIKRGVNANKFAEVKAHWQVESMDFTKRDACFTLLPEVVSELFESDLRQKVIEILKTTSIVPEAYFYSLLGRADLIKFSYALEKSPDVEDSSEE